MPQLQKPTTIRDHLDALTREASAIAARLSALTQEIEWLADSIDPKQMPMPDIQEIAA